MAGRSSVQFFFPARDAGIARREKGARVSPTVYITERASVGFSPARGTHCKGGVGRGVEGKRLSSVWVSGAHKMCLYLASFSLSLDGPTPEADEGKGRGGAYRLTVS